MNGIYLQFKKLMWTDMPLNSFANKSFQFDNIFDKTP